MPTEWIKSTLERSTFSKGWTSHPKFPIRKRPTKSDGLEMVLLGRNDFEVPRPTSLGEPGFEAELAEVVRVRHDVQAGVWPNWFLQDHGLTGMPASPFSLNIDDIYVDALDPVSAAHLVHMDDPMDLGKLLRKWVVSAGAVHVDSDSSGHGMFLETVPRFNRDLADAVWDALYESAQVKQFFGRARPEEVLGFNMTNYPEGCPKHPAYPAGHGAAAGATFAVVEKTFDMADDVREIAFNTAAQFAMFRTFAGVHYANDNIIGFLLGYAKTNGLGTVLEAASALGWGGDAIGD